MGKNRRSIGSNSSMNSSLMQDIDYSNYSDELLDKVDEALQDWVDSDNRDFNDDDEITDFIDENMILSTNQFYRVEPIDKTLKDLEEGDSLDFNDYFKSFSESKEASNEYMQRMVHDSEIVIFRTNGKIKSFNMSDYAGDYYWQEEHLIHGSDFKIKKINDVSDQYSYLGRDKVLMVDIVQEL